MSLSTEPDADLSTTLQYARDYFIENLPSGYAAMSSNDQSQKLRKRQVIETNWNAYIEDCVSEEIKPKQSAYRGHKAKIGDGAPAIPWWQWSMKFLIALDRLSGLTRRKLSFARELKLLEVPKRHKDMTNKARQWSELLAQDVDLIVAGLLKRFEQGPAEASEDGESEDELARDKEEEWPYVKREVQDEVSFAKTESLKESVQLKREITHDADEDVGSSPRKKAKQNHTPAKVATLRARAMRHKEQARRLEAEAFELEAKHLSELA
ncbi:hypothetical protein CLAFUW4_13383 [Fulvia fulva]|nr:hypothetical protein CLAFUR4_13387 [Fulvia fulva]WPV21199.1 hypothetical protein CLAFUW4_13383 [Fulvia fulva]WPV35881.1 hypothetical protein CLAFUW7_13390 [Fulvia fulva]